MPETQKSNNDLWVTEFDQVAFDNTPQTVEDAITANVEETILNPTIVSNVGQEDTEIVQPPVEAVAPEQVAPPAEDDEQVYDYNDGSRVAIKKTKKGWRATLDSGTGANPEVFYGATKDEMFANLAVGKINATKKIRELSRQPLLAADDHAPAPAPQPAPQTGPKRLSAEETFDFKAKFEENPDLALEMWLQKRSGKTPEQLVDLAETATRTSAEAVDTSKDTAISQILKDWVDITDDYFVHEANRDGLLAYLLKYKARVSPKNYNVSTALVYLYDRDLLTTESLDAAWEDLKESGQAVLERATVPAEQPAPVQQVRMRPRPAAGLGIRSSETRTVRPPDTPPDTPPDFSKMTLAESEQLLNDLRRMKINNPTEYERLKAIGDRKRGLPV